MKIYTNKSCKKSWAISLRDILNKECAFLEAVDSETGEILASILCFDSDGSIKKITGLEEALSRKGYDPYEHNNQFNEDGSILIKDTDRNPF